MKVLVQQVVTSECMAMEEEKKTVLTGEHY